MAGTGFVLVAEKAGMQQRTKNLKRKAKEWNLYEGR
jgi:hypothetical protein